jgi:hypothetical protein
MMKYIKVKWVHFHPDEPTLLYSELDDARWEIRKVEIFPDGRIGYASSIEATSATKTRLSIEPLPPFDEIAADPQFQPVEITKDEFEAVWSRRSSVSG